MELGVKLNRNLLSIAKLFQKRNKKFLHVISGSKDVVTSKSLRKNTFSCLVSKRDHSTPTEQITTCYPNMFTEEVSSITNEEYSHRRHRLMDIICKQSSKSSHIIIMPGTPRRYMIDKIPYLFRQDTDMLYLSGCREQDCMLVIHSLPNGKPPDHKAIMFTPSYDPSKELWDGPRTCDAKAPSKWGVDRGFPLTELASYLQSLERDLSNPDIWYHFLSPPNHQIHCMIQKWILKSRMGKLTSPKQHIHSLRWIKSPAEIELMREACRISAESIAATIKCCSSPTSEHRLFATVDYQNRMRGADYLAYPPVVAGGNRANIIHYINNNNPIDPGDMVLMDAGGEYKGYSGDVTRTWPISGKFSSGQRDLYEAVLEVQNYVITECANSRPSLDHLFVVMCAKLGSVLQEIGLLPRDIPKSQLSRAAYDFCPHHVSHFLGMDVHDTPLVRKCERLSPGCIITVEPGVYVSERNGAVPSRYHGLGVRIEDDILITESGIEILSKSCPRHPEEIEALVGAAL